MADPNTLEVGQSGHISELPAFFLQENNIELDGLRPGDSGHISDLGMDVSNFPQNQYLNELITVEIGDEVVEMPRGGLARYKKIIELTTNKGNTNNRLSDMYFLQFLGNESPEIQSRIDFLEKNANIIIPTKGLVEESLRATSEAIPTLLKLSNEGLEGGIRGGLVFGALALATTGVGAVAAVPAGFGAGFAVDFSLANWRFQTSMAFGEYSKFRDKDGNPPHPDAVKIGAATHGFIGAGIDFVPMGLIFRMVPGLKPLLSKASVEGAKKIRIPKSTNAMKDFVFNLSTLIAAEAGTEGVQDLSQIVIGEMIVKDDKFEPIEGEEIIRRVSDAVIESLKAGPLVSPAPIARLGFDVATASKYKKATGELKKQIKASNETPENKKALDKLINDEVKRIENMVENPDELISSFIELADTVEAMTQEEIFAALPADKLPETQAKRRERFERVGIKITEEDIVSLKEDIKRLKKKTKTQAAATKKEIKATQKLLIEKIEQSGIENRGKFLRRVKNTQTPRQLLNSAEAIQFQIDKEAGRAAKKEIRKQVQIRLNKVSPIKVGKKVTGKFDPETQAVLDILRANLRMKVDKKIKPISREEAQRRLDENLSAAIGTETALENRLLAMVADPDTVSVDDQLSILEAIEEIRRDGKVGADTRRLVSKDRSKKLVDGAVESIQGSKPIDPEDKTLKAPSLRKFFKGLSRTQTSWMQLMDIISSDDTSTKAGESRISRALDTFAVVQGENKGQRIAGNKIIQMTMDAFGFTDQKQVFRQMKQDSELIDLGTFEDANGKSVDLKMTKAEMRKRVMENRDETISEIIFDKKGNAWTEGMFKAVEDRLSTKDFAFIDAQIDFYKKYYKRINTVYAALRGVNLPDILNYSPIRRETVRDSEGVAGDFLLEQSFRRDVSASSLIGRVPSQSRLKDASDIQVIQQHVIEMEHFINWSRKVTDMNSVFKDTEIRKIITAKYGASMLTVIDRHIKHFTNIGLESSTALDSIFNALRVNMTTSVLALQPDLTAKQLVSFIAYADGISSKDFVSGIIDFAKNPKRAMKILSSSEFLLGRGQNINIDIKDATKFKNDFDLFTSRPTFRNAMFLMVRIGDRGAILMGGWAVYRAELKRTGDPAKAMELFERKSDETQQSGNIDQQSEFQRNAFLKLFTMFTSSQNQYFRQEMGAIRGFFTGRMDRKTIAKKIAIYHFVLPMLFQFVADGFRVDEDRQWRAAFLGSFNGVFILKDGMEFAARKLAGDDLFKNNAPVFELIRDSFEAAADLMLSWGDMEDFLDALVEVAEVGGKLSGLPVEQAFNLTEGVGELIEGDIVTGGLKTMGWSSYSLGEK